MRDQVSSPMPAPSSATAVVVPGRRGALQVLVALAAIAACYAWVDQPLAWFVHDHQLRRDAWLDGLTRIPDLLVVASALVLVAAPLRCACRRAWSLAERVVLAMAVSLALAAFVKEQLKVLFGRAWPETWTHGNPSLIHDGVYGFFWFRADNAFHSFPSGHTALSAAAMAVLWHAAPRWRWLAAAVVVAVVVGLLGMDYHFLSDTLAGALVGSICGTLVWRFVQSASGRGAERG